MWTQVVIWLQPVAGDSADYRLPIGGLVRHVDLDVEPLALGVLADPGTRACAVTRSLRTTAPVNRTSSDPRSSQLGPKARPSNSLTYPSVVEPSTIAPLVPSTRRAYSSPWTESGP